MGPEVQFERPRRAVLLDQAPVGVGDRVGVEVRRPVVDVGAGRQDAARPEFSGYRLGQTAAGELGGAEPDGARPPADGSGAGEDDGAAVALQYVLDGGLRAVQRRLRADRQRPPERFGVLFQQTVPRRRAGVVDEYVHPGRTHRGPARRRANGDQVREIRRDGQCVAGRLRPESVGQRLEVRLRAGEQPTEQPSPADRSVSDAPRLGPRPAMTAVLGMSPPSTRGVKKGYPVTGPYSSLSAASARSAGVSTLSKLDSDPWASRSDRSTTTCSRENSGSMMRTSPSASAARQASAIGAGR